MKNNKDKKEVLAAVKQYGRALEDADKSLQKDKAIVLAAVKQDGFALKYADKSLRKDKAIVLAAVKKRGRALEYADKSLQKDKAIVLAAVKLYGLVLQYADKSLRKDKAIVLATVKQNGIALKYADKSLRKDKAIVLAAVKQAGYALGYADKSLQKDKAIVLAAVKQAGGALQYADKSLQKDKAIVLAAIEQDPEAAKFADPSYQDEIGYTEPLIGELTPDCNVEIEWADYAANEIKNEEDFFKILKEYLWNRRDGYPETYIMFDLDILNVQGEPFKENYKQDKSLLIPNPTKKLPYQLIHEHTLEDAHYEFTYVDQDAPLDIEYQIYDGQKFLSGITQKGKDCEYSCTGDGGTHDQFITFRFLNKKGKVSSIRSSNFSLPLELNEENEAEYIQEIKGAAKEFFNKIR